jgi:RHS repeat-associated protein
MTMAMVFRRRSNFARILCASIALSSLSMLVPHSAEAQECYQWKWIDNGESGWLNDWSTAVQAWRAAKNDGAQPTGCGAPGRLYDISPTITPNGEYPGYYYTFTARGAPDGDFFGLACTLTWARSCPVDYYLNSESDPPCQDGNCVGDPILVESGAVVVKQDDVPPNFTGLAFSRFYNSRNPSTSSLSQGWNHSYSRRVVERRSGAKYRPYGTGAGSSSLYADEASACGAGFLQVRAKISNWGSAVATYSGGECTVSVGGSAVGTITVHTQTVPEFNPGATLLGFDVVRDNGQVIRLDSTGAPPTGVTLEFETIPGGYKVTDDADTVETYGAGGKLLSVQYRGGVTHTPAYDGLGRLVAISDNFGHVISLTREASSDRIATVTDAGGRIVTYGYDTANRLVSANNGDGTSRTYVYEHGALPYTLTGIIDESASRLSTWIYDMDRRGTETYEGANINSHVLVFNADSSVTVMDALGAVRTFTFERYGDRFLSTAITGSPCPTCKDGAATTYDSNGFVASRRDYNGNLTCFAHDAARGLELYRVEGFSPATAACPADLAIYIPATGTRERKIAMVWHSGFHLPTSITQANRTTAFTHDANGNVLTRTITDTSVTPSVSRSWTYTYDSFGRVLTENGPRTDVTDLTTFTYHSCTTGAQCGRLNTLTNAAGHVTTYNAYNAHGQPTQITDPNGLVTSFAYDTRQRMSDACAGGTLPACVGGELTHIDYWPTGLLKKVTNPDGSFVQYTYDAAHRLTQVQDGAGNKIVYTLDNAGNQTAENVFDPSLVLKRTHTRVFNTLGRLWKDVNAAGTASVTTTFGYDGNGNQTTASAPLSRNSTSLFDELDRLKQITDSASGITQLGYDAHGNLTSVTDPRSLVTSYTYTGFADLKTQVSPDTGLTTNTHDSGGNLTTSTVARNAITTYTYDVLDRLKSAAFKIGTTTDQTITYTYDGGTNQKGQLTGASDSRHSMSWTYDAKGRVTGKSQVFTAVTPNITRSIGYGYNAAGQLVSTVLPSSATIQYGYNSNGQVTSVTLVGSPNVTILNNVAYDPFGPVIGWTWGNGTATMSRTFDADGKLTTLSNTPSAVGERTLNYDDAFRITSTTDSATGGPSWTLGYDALDRLSSALKTGTSIGYTYDANGNRLSQTGTSASIYTVSGSSNRLSSTAGALSRSYTYDAVGNTLTSGATVHTYNNRGRMKTGRLASTGTNTNYDYNALGQRMRKAGGTPGTIYFDYDEAGHLVGEYNSTGGLVQETVWLGDIPVATLRPRTGGGFDVFYVHTDQLNTPRKVTRPSDNQLRWRWDPTPFGEGAPNENPSALGAFKYHLRFPGQYFDVETNLNYNYFRDYDPASGRYVQSDPIGLRGGLNTYTYANVNPLSNMDPQGLEYGAAYAADLRSLGWKPRPAELRHIRPEVKAYLCQLIRETDGKIKMVHRMSLAERKGDLPDSWQDPLMHDAENWAYAAAWGPNWFDITAYQLSKPFRSHTTEWSIRAWLAGLGGRRFQNATPAQLLEWCDNGCKN